MPKTKLSQPIKIDHVAALLRECIRKSDMTVAEVSKKLGYSHPTCLSAKFRRGSDGWNLEFIKLLAETVNCPMDELADAIAKDLR